MNCRNCGLTLSTIDKFCPNCGAPVNNMSTNNNVGGMNVPNSVPSNPSVNMGAGLNNLPNVPTGLNSSVNVSSSNDIGFNRNMEQDLSQFGSNDPYANRVNTMNSGNLMNSSSSVDIKSNINTGMQMYFPGESKKKKFPWFGIAIGLVVIMIGGLIMLPFFNTFNLKTYDSDEFQLKYNNNWRLDENQDKMTLYYSDNDSRFLLNAVTTYTSLNYIIDDEADKKKLYDAFYDAWSNVVGGELTGGTETFLTLNDEAMYARIDYKMIDRKNIGSFYIIVSPKKDKVISFMSYCTSDNWNKINNDVIDMLKSLTCSSEAASSAYNKFNAGETKDYSSIGYMDYKIPDSWSLDEEKTKNASYKSYIFKFRDGVSLLDVKAVTPYNSATAKTGTTYDEMRATIIKNYGEIKSETTKTINGKTWYVLVTSDYTSGNNSYHNEFYFTFSASNKHLYYFEAYVWNETGENKTKYFNESVEYILKSAKLYKVDE